MSLAISSDYALEGRCRALLEALPMAMAVCDLEGGIKIANQQFNQLAGLDDSEGQPLQRVLPEIFLESKQHDGCCLLCDVFENLAEPHEIYLQRFGEHRVAQATFHVLNADDESLVLITLSDRTEHLEATKRLLQSERTSILSRACSSIARQLSEMVKDVLEHAALADLADSKEGYRRCAEVAQLQLGRAAKILDKLVPLGEPSASSEEPVPVIEAAESAVKGLQTALDENQIGFTMEVEPGICTTIQADRLAIMLSHLLRNAMEATPADGSIALNVRSASPDDVAGLLSEKRRETELWDLESRLDAFRSAGDALALIQVRDSGAGIQDEDVAKLFEPLYTTKGSTGAQGLGLTICHTIVDRAGGFILIDSIPGSGTTCTVILPQKAATGLLGGTEAIDVERVRRVLAGTRTAQGRVLVAGKSESAVQVADVLRLAGYRSGHAESLMKASNEAQERSYDLVLIEADLLVKMDPEDEHEISRTVFSLPIVLLAGPSKGHAPSIPEQTQASIKATIEQPWDLWEIFQAVRKAFQE